MTPLLSVEALCLGYGRSIIIPGLSLTVAAGEIVALIGANGAGKTTSLRGISGLTRPRSGSVKLEGRDLAGLPTHQIAALGVVQVPEGRQIFASLSVAENLALGGISAAASVARIRRDQVLTRFPRLAERLGQSAGSLSGGEQQMLAIGRALMADPRVLLLDEPSMGLAPKFVEVMFSLIEELRRDGRTILLVEQNASAALAIADRAYVLNQGRVSLTGSGSEVAANPAVVTAYLGG